MWRHRGLITCFASQLERSPRSSTMSGRTECRAKRRAAISSRRGSWSRPTDSRAARDRTRCPSCLLGKPSAGKESRRADAATATGRRCRPSRATGCPRARWPTRRSLGTRSCPTQSSRIFTRSRRVATTCSRTRRRRRTRRSYMRRRTRGRTGRPGHPAGAVRFARGGPRIITRSWTNPRSGCRRNPKIRPWTTARWIWSRTRCTPTRTCRSETRRRRYRSGITT